MKEKQKLSCLPPGFYKNSKNRMKNNNLDCFKKPSKNLKNFRNNCGTYSEEKVN